MCSHCPRSLPSGYSVAFNGVFDPEGETVSVFPSSVLAPVIAQATTTSDPGAPNSEETSSAASPSPSAPAAGADENGAALAKPSLALAAVAIAIAFMA